jgi:hypothetical protein
MNSFTSQPYISLTTILAHPHKMPNSTHYFDPTPQPLPTSPPKHYTKNKFIASSKKMLTFRKVSHWGNPRGDKVKNKSSDNSSLL